MSRAPARALRVVVLAGASLLLATLGHLLGGGVAPGVGTLLAAGALVAVFACTATARRCRLPVLVPLLVIEQALLHVWFAGAAMGSSCEAMASTHHAGVTALSCSAPTGAAMTAATPATMWAAHLVATLATAWLLARGEDWLWRQADQVVAAASASPSRRRRLRLLVVTHRQPTAPRCRAWRPAAPRGPPHSVLI